MQTVCIIMILIVKNNNNQMEYGLSGERSPQSVSHSVSGAEAESFES